MSDKPKRMDPAAGPTTFPSDSPQAVQGSPRGVIFDMDGVLVDSYWAHLKSWQVVAAEEGRTITEEEFAATFGRTSREIIAAWPNAHYTQQQIAELDRRKEAAFREILDRNFTPMPGVHEMLEGLARAGFRLAVGSSGPPENVALVLRRLGWADRFSAVVDGMDVRRGKPDPEVFLLAAQRAGLEPNRCVVVEDAPLGVEAAHRAGMKAIGLVSTGRTADQLAAADLVVRRLEEITPEQVLALLQ